MKLVDMLGRTGTLRIERFATPGAFLVLPDDELITRITQIGSNAWPVICVAQARRLGKGTVCAHDGGVPLTS